MPILFHPLKHHLYYIRSFIQSGTTATATALQAAFLTIGRSQLDLYFGSLSPLQIAEEALVYLQERHLLQPEVYRRYLAATGAGYRLVTLSDATDWVLRWGVAPGRHVHLHPARYTAHTLRVKANVLKTAVAAMIAAARWQESINLPLVNRVRAGWLGLPPLKDFSMEDGAGRLVALLQAGH